MAFYTGSRIGVRDDGQGGQGRRAKGSGTTGKGVRDDEANSMLKGRIAGRCYVWEQSPPSVTPDLIRGPETSMSGTDKEYGLLYWVPDRGPGRRGGVAGTTRQGGQGTRETQLIWAIAPIVYYLGVIRILRKK